MECYWTMKVRQKTFYFSSFKVLAGLTRLTWLTWTLRPWLHYSQQYSSCTLLLATLPRYCTFIAYSCCDNFCQLFRYIPLTGSRVIITGDIFHECPWSMYIIHRYSYFSFACRSNSDSWNSHFITDTNCTEPMDLALFSAHWSSDIMADQIYANFTSVNSLWTIPQIFYSWLTPKTKIDENGAILYKEINHHTLFRLSLEEV
jgi:hypothetical protein